MRTNEMNQKIKYFVLEFAIDEDSEKTSSMCVLGYRQPSFEEAEEFWKKDCAKFPDEELHSIYEITSKQAHNEFDMKDEASFPVFGTDRKNCIEILSDFANEEFAAFEKYILSKSKEEILDRTHKIMAIMEIHGYLCDCAGEDLDGHAIKVLADLGNEVLEVLYHRYMKIDNASIMFYSEITEWVEAYCKELIANEI